MKSILSVCVMDHAFVRVCFVFAVVTLLLLLSLCLQGGGEGKRVFERLVLLRPCHFLMKCLKQACHVSVPCDMECIVFLISSYAGGGFQDDKA